MFDIFSAIFLGTIQGVTEFLPISSSGHLIVVREVFGMTVANSLFFDVFLHFATVLAIIVYFRKDIMSLFSFHSKSMLYALLLGTIPAVIVGLLFEDVISTTLRSPYVVVGSLFLGSLLFFFAESRALQDKMLSLPLGIGIGFFQVLAFIPGFSRSGATISGGLIFGLKRDEAARFSFLLGIPVMLGAVLLESVQSFDIIVSGGIGIDVIVGGITAFIVGLCSIRFLMTYLKSHRLAVFAWYRIILAILLFVYFI